MNIWSKLSIAIGLILIYLAVFLGFGWWLVTSINISNTALAIKARHYYYLNLAPKLGQDLKKLPFDIIPMQTMETTDGTLYAYTMVGQYQYVDLDNQILYLKTKNGNVYGFNYTLDLNNDLIYSEKNEEGIIESNFFQNNPLNENDTITVQWTDKRILKEILARAEIDSQKLVNPYLTADDFTTIVKN